MRDCVLTNRYNKVKLIILTRQNKIIVPINIP